MDTAVTVAIAQILTGAATLVVAVFLAGQLLIHRKVLDRAHLDAERELTLSSLSLFQDHLNSRVTNESVRNLYAKRHEGLSSLSTSEFDGITTHFRMGYLITNNEWSLGRAKNFPGYYIKRFQGYLDSVAGREYYVQTGRAILNRDRLVEIADEVFEELTGEAVPAEAGRAIGFVEQE